MARPLRIQIKDGHYHVNAHGNQERWLFRDDQDRRAFLGILASVVKRCHWEIWAYCLLGTHYHLLFRTPEPNLAEGMRELNGAFAALWNRRHRKRGHVFEDRYHSVLIECDEHLLQASRYIVFNPVEARMCADPADWPWSSYADTAAGRSTAVLNPGPLLAMLRDQFGPAEDAYERFIAAGSRIPVRGAHAVLGSPQFARDHLPPPAAVRNVPRRYWQDNRPPLGELLGSNPTMADVRLARDVHRYTLDELGRALGCDPRTVARRLAREWRGARREPSTP